MYYNVIKCSVNAIENAPFTIIRNEMVDYLFLFFSCQVTININGEELDYPPGTCILYEPLTYQHFYVNKNRLNHSFITFSLNISTFFNDIKFPVNKPIILKNTEKIIELMHQIIEEENGIKLGNKYKRDSLMTELFIYISRVYHSKKTYSNEIYVENQRTEFEEIRLEMYKYPDILSVSAIAKKAGYSLVRFTELYKKFFGTTPIDDLTQARIIRVKILLQEETKTKEIVKLLGFSSEIYFYRWFKSNFKMTINEYKEKLKNEE